ncbi:MAG TPA: Uma2 family endonuclease, partial [Candidatus Sulfotelmatobacter sp.]|nr:Uma2 family endonuclease [Candidatus Sulfotelmatobacter sp.]
IASILGEHVSRHRLGRVLMAPMDVLLSETNIVQPDVLFLRAERLPPSDAANIQVAPDLAVEVISPSTVTEDREYKKAVYARHGVAHYWLVDPDARTLEMYVLSGASYALAAEFAGSAAAASPLFPGLSIALAQLWV